MLQLWKARRGRKAAVAMIAPLLERSRANLGQIPGEAWHDPYLVGFMAMLASLEAVRAVGTLSSHALGLVQSETMAELSGEHASVHGEEICNLSLGDDPCFLAGCRQASLFHAAMQRMDAVVLTDAYQDSACDGDHAYAMMGLHQLWSQAFEPRVLSLL